MISNFGICFFGVAQICLPRYAPAQHRCLERIFQPRKLFVPGVAGRQEPPRVVVDPAEEAGIAQLLGIIRVRKPDAVASVTLHEIHRCGGFKLSVRFAGRTDSLGGPLLLREPLRCEKAVDRAVGYRADRLTAFGIAGGNPSQLRDRAARMFLNQGRKLFAQIRVANTGERLPRRNWQTSSPSAPSSRYRLARCPARISASNSIASRSSGGVPGLICGSSPNSDVAARRPVRSGGTASIAIARPRIGCRAVRGSRQPIRSQTAASLRSTFGRSAASRRYSRRITLWVLRTPATASSRAASRSLQPPGR